MAEAQDPDLIDWQKSPDNPVIAHPPEGVNQTDFRDPYVWLEGDTWKLAIGAGMADGDSAILLYESSDLLAWNYLGPLYKSGIHKTVTMWKCPNFFKLGEKYVLVVSLFPGIQGVYYFVGGYDGHTFRPDWQGFFDSGPIFYAPQVRTFDDGRTIMFSWLLEGRDDAANEVAGWAGVQAIPRELYLDENDRLLSRLISEITTLCKKENVFTDINLRPDEQKWLDVHGKRLEIETEIGATSGKIGLGVLASPGGEEVSLIFYDFSENRAVLDLTGSSLLPGILQNRQSINLAVDPDDSVKFQVFIDGSVIEVWINERIAISGRAYPALQESDGLYLFTEQTAGKLHSLRVWEMACIWPSI